MSYPKIIKGVTYKLETREVVDNVDTGRRMKERRLLVGISLRAIAEKIGCSHVYVSDLEKGRRAWTWQKVEAYKNAMNSQSKGG